MRAVSSGRSKVGSVMRTALGFVALAAAYLVWAERTGYRGVEARLAAFGSGALIQARDLVHPDSATYFLRVGTDRVFAVVVTPECSSAIVTASVIGVAGLILAGSRVPVAQIVLASLAAVGLFLTLNIARLVLITYSSDKWGLDTGYHWSHLWAGTAITVFGGALTVMTFLVVLAGGPNARPVQLLSPRRDAEEKE